MIVTYSNPTTSSHTCDYKTASESQNQLTIIACPQSRFVGNLTNILQISVSVENTSTCGNKCGEIAQCEKLVQNNEENSSILEWKSLNICVDNDCPHQFEIFVHINVYMFQTSKTDINFIVDNLSTLLFRV